MKKIEIIRKNVEKEITPDSIDQFINDAKRYIKATREGRMLCNIDTVSKSGMSRTIQFLSCEKFPKSNQFDYYNYFAFFRALGYKPTNHNATFRINGCGMDMVFNTNYNIIHKLHRLGFISKKECEFLAQQTPCKF